jgi:uncharacterized cofD-like protein
MKKKKIVTIGGGTGQFTLLSGLRDFEGLEITAVASMADSGGSSGKLRDEWGVLPPSDIYRCMLALSPYASNPDIRKLLLHRFDGEDLKRLDGHTIGNMILTVLTQWSGDFMTAVHAVSRWLEVKGRVLPVTMVDAHLMATSEAARYRSEAAIGRREETTPFKDIVLVPDAEAYPPVLEAIREADLAVIGPGDVVTSLVVHSLVEGVAKEIQTTKARLVYVVNVMTRFAETDGFKASDHVRMIEKYFGRKVDFIICNNAKSDQKVLSEYAGEKAFPVELDIERDWEGRKVIAANLLGSGSMARHDPKRLATLVASCA